MNAWLLAAAVLLFGLIPCGIVSYRGSAMDRLVGLEMAGIVESLLLILLAQAMHNPNFYDLALAMSLLAFGGGLVFVRFLERWL
jgi:multisubunit Na+/H+ antiporter MnhF subunit